MAEAEPVHAGVDLEMAAEPHAARAAAGLERARGGRRRDGRRQAVLEDAVEIADAQRAEHQNRNASTPASRSDDALFDVRARQHRARRPLRARARPRAAPWPYAFALTTAMTSGAARRATVASPRDEQIADRARGCA